jgi:hypothetical protein
VVGAEHLRQDGERRPVAPLGLRGLAQLAPRPAPEVRSEPGHRQDRGAGVHEHLGGPARLHQRPLGVALLQERSAQRERERRDRLMLRPPGFLGEREGPPSVLGRTDAVV